MSTKIWLDVRLNKLLYFQMPKGCLDEHVKISYYIEHVKIRSLMPRTDQMSKSIRKVSSSLMSNFSPTITVPLHIQRVK